MIEVVCQHLKFDSGNAHTYGQFLPRLQLILLYFLCSFKCDILLYIQTLEMKF